MKRISWPTVDGNEVWQWIIFAGLLFDTRALFGPVFAVGAFVGAIIIRVNGKDMKVRLARLLGKRRIAYEPKHASRRRLMQLLDGLDYVYNERLTQQHQRDTYLVYYQNPEDSDESLQIWYCDNGKYGREYEVMSSYEYRLSNNPNSCEYSVRRYGYRFLADLTNVEYIASRARFEIGSVEPEMLKEITATLNAIPESFAEEIEDVVQNWKVVTGVK